MLFLFLTLLQLVLRHHLHHPCRCRRLSLERENIGCALHPQSCTRQPRERLCKSTV